MTTNIPAPARRSLAPAITLIAAGAVAWVFLVLLVAVHAVFIAGYRDPDSDVAILSIIIVLLELVCFGAEVIAVVLGIILGIIAFRRRPVRAPIASVIGLALIVSSVVGSYFILGATTLPAGYITG